ncbi:DoxX family protein [Amycolatopsis sp. NPDC052450]|uniref:DoxX family protein n=1 Tax=Amycolatopsis sp. NPDC052450 TaxID=3363937 RepID=UPI0037CB6077
MTTAYVIVTVVGAFMAAYSAASIFFRAKWVVKPLADYGVPRGWWTPLGVAKAAGALGLIAGLWVPALGVAAGIGLVLYFTGAVITVLRARWLSHVAFPLMYLAPVAASLVLGFAA